MLQRATLNEIGFSVETLVLTQAVREKLILARLDFPNGTQWISLVVGKAAVIITTTTTTAADKTTIKIVVAAGTRAAAAAILSTTSLMPTPVNGAIALISRPTTMTITTVRIRIVTLMIRGATMVVVVVTTLRTTLVIRGTTRVVVVVATSMAMRHTARIRETSIATAGSRRHLQPHYHEVCTLLLLIQQGSTTLSKYL